MSLLSWLRRKASKEVEEKPALSQHPGASSVAKPDVAQLARNRDMAGLLATLRYDGGTTFSVSTQVQGDAAKALAQLADPRAADAIRAAMQRTERDLQTFREISGMGFINALPDKKRENQETIRCLTALKANLAEALTRCTQYNPLDSATSISTKGVDNESSSMMTVSPENTDQGEGRSSTSNRQICCVCFEDQEGRPVMLDKATGNVFCQQHSYCFSEMQRGLNTRRCPSCGFGYYESYGSYVKGDTKTCPKCGGHF